MTLVATAFPPAPRGEALFTLSNVGSTEPIRNADGTNRLYTPARAAEIVEDSRRDEIAAAHDAALLAVLHGAPLYYVVFRASVTASNLSAFSYRFHVSHRYGALDLNRTTVDPRSGWVVGRAGLVQDTVLARFPNDCSATIAVTGGAAGAVDKTVMLASRTPTNPGAIDGEGQA